MSVKVYAVEQPDLAPLEMPDRFRHDVTYFMTPSGESGAPKLDKQEYWIRAEDARRWLEDFVVPVISPLDSRSKTEIELTDDQELWLEWMLEHGIQRIRLGAR